MCFFLKFSTKGPRNLTNLGGLKVEGGEMIVMAAKLNFTNCSSLSHGGGFHSDQPLKQEMGQIHFRFLDVEVLHFFGVGKFKTGTRCDYIIKNEWHSSLETKRAAGPLKISTSKMVFLNKNWLMFVVVVVFRGLPWDFFVQEVFGNSTQITKNMTQELDGLSKPFDLPKTREVSKFPRNFRYNEL